MGPNSKPCNTCKMYYPIRVGAGTMARRGWCAALSLYPHEEQPGQVFPPGVKRAEAGQLAKPVIKIGSQVVSGCPHYTPKK